MICTTLQNRSLEEIFDLLENSSPTIQMAEIRLDRCPLNLDGIEELFSSSDTPLIATCRVAGDGSGTWEEAEAKLRKAIEAGAAFVDLEIEAPKEIGKRLRRACNEFGTTMIRSCHFFQGVPSEESIGHGQAVAMGIIMAARAGNPVSNVFEGELRSPMQLCPNRRPQPRDSGHIQR